MFNLPQIKEMKSNSATEVNQAAPARAIILVSAGISLSTTNFNLTSRALFDKIMGRWPSALDLPTLPQSLKEMEERAPHLWQRGCI